MKKVIVFTLLMSGLLVSTSSCEWIGVTFLGKPTKAELAKKAQEEQFRKDSTDNAERAQIAELEKAQQEEVQVQLGQQGNALLKGERFHIILGCFKEPSNATRMLALLAEKGFTQAQKFNLGDFECISAASFRTSDEAYGELFRIMNEDYCPEDFWLYDTRTNPRNLGN